MNWVERDYASMFPVVLSMLMGVFVSMLLCSVDSPRGAPQSPKSPPPGAVPLVPIGQPLNLRVHQPATYGGAPPAQQQGALTCTSVLAC